MLEPCAVEGCDKPRKKSRRYCAAHQRKYERTGEPPTKPVRKYRSRAWDRVVEALGAYAAADTPDEFRRARDLVRKHAIAWAAELLGRRTENVGNHSDTSPHGQRSTGGEPISWPSVADSADVLVLGLLRPARRRSSANTLLT